MHHAPVVWHLWVFLVFIVVILPEIVGAAFSPQTRDQLKHAVDLCLEEYPGPEECSNSPYGTTGMWDVSQIADMNKLFYGAIAFNNDISKWDVSRVTDMAYIFWGTLSFNGDISNWDVSHVNTMTGAFISSVFNNDISKWDVSSVTNMRFMFYGASAFNGDISKWDVSRVTDMRSMFQNARVFNRDISNWNVLGVDHMSFMFYGATSFSQELCKAWRHTKAKKYDMFKDSQGSISRCIAFGPPTREDLKTAVDKCLKRSTHCTVSPRGAIGTWDVSSVTDMNRMFYGALEFNGDISKWDVSRVTSMAYMFWGTLSFNGDLSKWDVSHVKDMTHAFYGAISFKSDISNWDVSRVTNMAYLFWGEISFNGDISRWDVSKVTDMRFMFYGATAFNGDISKWDVSRVIDMSSMFQNAEAFNGDISKWDVSKVAKMGLMFYGAKSFKRKLCNRWIHVKAKKDYMFIGSQGEISKFYCEAFKPQSREDVKNAVHECLKRSGDCSQSAYGAIGTWDVSRVANMKKMFYGALEFNGDISKWDVSRVTSMAYMFWGAISFDGDISKWVVSSVTNMAYIFYGTILFHADISKWDVSRVTDMAGACVSTAFNSDVSKWDVSSVTDMSYMFYSANLFDGDISRWDVSRVTTMRSMFHNANEFNSDVSKWDVSRVAHMEFMFYGATSFKQNICGTWVQEKAKMYDMFQEFVGSSFLAECTSPRPTQRALKACPSCPVLRLYGILGFGSCCHFGGAWYKQCGKPGDPNFEHTWQEGVAACRRTRKAMRVETTQHLVCSKCGINSKSGSRNCCARGGDWFQKCGTGDKDTAQYTWAQGYQACAMTTTSTTTHESACPKCGSKKHSGQRSCCARGGAWVDKCGMPGDPNVEHTWDEGIQACATAEALRQSAFFGQVDRIVVELHNSSAQRQIIVSPNVTAHYAVTSRSSDHDRVFKIVDLTIVLITILCMGVCSFN